MAVPGWGWPSPASWPATPFWLLARPCRSASPSTPATPWSATVLGRLVAEHTDIPAGVLNVITSQQNAIGEVLCTDPRIDLVSFTGSTRAGRRVAELAGRDLRRVTLELGGKSPCVVLDDADLARAVPACVASAFQNSGQTCSALTRLIVPRARLAEATELAAALVDWLDRVRGAKPDPRLEKLKAYPNFTFIEADILDRPKLAAAMQGAERVIHLAAIAGVRYSMEHPEEYIAINIQGFFHVIDEVKKQGGVKKHDHGGTKAPTPPGAVNPSTCTAANPTPWPPCATRKAWA